MVLRPSTDGRRTLALGKKPRRGRKDDLPKPTELMKQREGSLELEKNLNKTIVVQNTGNRGPVVTGFYCETCNRTYKDSSGYLDHINGRARNHSTVYAVLDLFLKTFLQICVRWVRRQKLNVLQSNKFAFE